jgi:hypothetical protein
MTPTRGILPWLFAGLGSLSIAALLFSLWFGVGVHVEGVPVAVVVAVDALVTAPCVVVLKWLVEFAREAD